VNVHLHAAPPNSIILFPFSCRYSSRNYHVAQILSVPAFPKCFQQLDDDYTRSRITSAFLCIFIALESLLISLVASFARCDTTLLQVPSLSSPYCVEAEVLYRSHYQRHHRPGLTRRYSCVSTPTKPALKQRLREFHPPSLQDRRHHLEHGRIR